MTTHPTTETITALFTPTARTYSQAEVEQFFSEAAAFVADPLLDGLSYDFRRAMGYVFLRIRFQVGGAA